MGTCVQALVANKMIMLELPQDVLLRIARILLFMSSAAVLQFAHASNQVKARLVSVLQAVSLQWAKSLSCKVTMSTNSLSARISSRDIVNGWIAGTLLPTTGRFSFSVRVDHAAERAGAVPALQIGVCNKENNHAWGLDLFSGMLVRQCKQDGLLRDQSCLGKPPPGFQDVPQRCSLIVDGTSVMLRGHPIWLLPPNHRSTVIKVIVILDVPCGKLQFRVFASNYAHSGQLLVPTLNGFPQGVTLRPWALIQSGGS